MMDLLFGDSAPPLPAAPRRPLVQPGDAMPELALQRLGAGEEPLAGLWSGGPAALAIGHAECPTSRLAFPYFERLRARTPALARTALVMQEDAAGAIAFARELALAEAPLLEADPYPLAAALGLRTVPTLLLIERGGRVARVVEGFDPQALEDVAAALGVPGPLLEAQDAAKRRPG